MTRIAVVGGGLGGLASALFLGRRGHDVTLVERDVAAPTCDPETDFANWRRPGVPQARQPHAYMARARHVLAAEAPDVLAALLGAGGTEMDALARYGELEREPDDAELWSLGMRRLAFEPHLRRAVESTSEITLLSGVAGEGLVLHPTKNATVAGLRLSTGDVIDADLIVDASGRRSPLGSWLAELNLAPMVEEAQDLRFVYATRWYRLCEEASPPVPATVLEDLGFAAAVVFPADRGVVALTITMSVDDPLRSQIRDPDRFDRLLPEIPGMVPWLEAGLTPITDVVTMARIENRARWLVRNGRPVVAGVVAVADSALHTNPTLGRGSSIAFLHAQHLADVVDAECADPSFAVDFHNWTVENLAPWYRRQVSTDGALLARVETALRGNELPPSPVAILNQAASVDPVIARAAARYRMMLGDPDELRGPTFLERIALAAEKAGPAPVSVLTRARFESLLNY